MFSLLPPPKAKQVELQFSVGEAISSASVGTRSGAARDPWTCSEDQYRPPPGTCPRQASSPGVLARRQHADPSPPPRRSPSGLEPNDVVPWVLGSVLSRYICSQNPHVRQAACIWLLSLVKRLSQHQEITVGPGPGSSLVSADARHPQSIEPLSPSPSPI